MKIKTSQNKENKKISILIKKTLLAIAIVIVFFAVIAKTGEYLRDYLINNVYNTVIDIEDAEQRIDLKSINYYSAVYNLNGVSHDKYVELKLGEGADYKVEFTLGDESEHIIISTQKTTYQSHLYLIPKHIYEKGYDKVSVTPIFGQSGFWVNNVKLHSDVNLEDYKDYEVVDFEVKQIDITIDPEHIESLAKHRADARAREILLAQDAQYYPATANVEGKSYDIEMRLKGDWVDHLNSSKWSFRLKLDNECIWGMEKLSLQSPESRKGRGEYLVHQMFSENGGVALSYDFVRLIINGEYWGVYAVEQAFDKRVVENSLKREGVIVKIDESYMWERRAYYQGGKIGFYEYSNFDVFSPSKTISNEKLYGYSQYAIEILNRVMTGEMPVEEAFDLDMYAKYYAICDVFKASHGTMFHNMRFYFNPVTAKIEPITFDQECNYQDYVPSSYQGEVISKPLFNNENFVNLYIKYLKKYTLDYDKFLNEHEEILGDYDYLLKTDEKVAYEYDYTDVFDDHHKFILDTIDKDCSEFISNQDGEGNQYIQVKNNSILNINVQKVLYDGEEIIFMLKDHGRKIYYEDKLEEVDSTKFLVEYVTLFDGESKTQYVGKIE